MGADEEATAVSCKQELLLPSEFRWPQTGMEENPNLRQTPNAVSAHSEYTSEFPILMGKSHSVM